MTDKIDIDFENERYAPDVNPDLIFGKAPSVSKSDTGLIIDSVGDKHLPPASIAPLSEKTLGETDQTADVVEPESIVRKSGKRSKKVQADKSDDMVELFIPADHVDNTKEIKLSINCTDYVIPLSESVFVPRFVRDYWETMNRDRMKFGNQRKRFADNN